MIIGRDFVMTLKSIDNAVKSIRVLIYMSQENQ